MILVMISQQLVSVATMAAKRKFFAPRSSDFLSLSETKWKWNL